jgi:hypothetical protein
VLTVPPPAQFVIRYGYVVLVGVVALIVPFALHATTFRQTTELTFLAPRNSGGVQAYNRMSQLFSPGLLDPYAVRARRSRTACRMGTPCCFWHGGGTLHAAKGCSISVTVVFLA